MKIYDRYKLDSSGERQRQADRGAKARRGIRKDYSVIQTCAAVSFAVFFGILVVLWLFCGCSRTPFRMLFLQACVFCWERPLLPALFF